jgi:hypothetical protein
MGCGYSTPKSVRDEILEIEHFAMSETREKKKIKVIDELHCGNNLIHCYRPS